MENYKDKRKEFFLKIGGLSLGKHCSSIHCDKTFFDIAEMKELQNGDIQVEIEMRVEDKMSTINFHFSGFVVAACDRCLDPVQVPMNFSETLLVKQVEHPEEFENQEDENIWYIDEREDKIDIFHFVYESILLAMPMQVIHPDDENGHSTCNPDILKKIEELSNAREEIDPRWEALKNIKLQ